MTTLLNRNYSSTSNLLFCFLASVFFAIPVGCNEKKSAESKGVRTSKIQEPAYPKTDLMGIWTYDPDGPHADFQLTKESYFVVDYDGDGNMPYQIRGDSIVVFFGETTMHGKITKARNDTMIIAWDNQEPVVYTRWQE